MVELALGALFFAAWLLATVETWPVRWFVDNGWIIEHPWSTKLLLLAGLVALPVAIADVVRDWRAYNSSLGHRLTGSQAHRL
jgi:hypothetical protein